MRLAPVPGALGVRILPNETVVPGILVALVGWSFAVWARVVLGHLWSSAITLKQGHVVVTSGPYRVVRHPIYTGILLAILGTALSVGTSAATLGLIMVIGTYLAKIRREDRWLLALFGAEYECYRGRVPTLVPHLLISHYYT